jgi:hypothetical protein
MLTYRRRPSATWRRLRTGVILAVPGATEALQLNVTGALIWDLLEEPMEAATLTGVLAGRFAQPEAEVAPAVGQLLDELVASGALVRQ